MTPDLTIHSLGCLSLLKDTPGKPVNIPIETSPKIATCRNRRKTLETKDAGCTVSGARPRTPTPLFLSFCFRNYREGPSWLLETGRPPGALLKMTAWGQGEAAVRAFVFQGQTEDHPPLGTAHCPGQECCSFFHLVLPESQSPPRTLFIPCYKKSGLERKGKRSVRV